MRLDFTFIFKCFYFFLFSSLLILWDGPHLLQLRFASFVTAAICYSCDGPHLLQLPSVTAALGPIVTAAIL